MTFRNPNHLPLKDLADAEVLEVVRAIQAGKAERYLRVTGEWRKKCVPTINPESIYRVVE